VRRHIYGSSSCRSQRVSGCRTFVGSNRRCSLIDQYQYGISCRSSHHGSAHHFVCCPFVRLFGFRNYFPTDTIAELLVSLHTWESHETRGRKYSVWAKYGVFLMLKEMIHVARSALQTGTTIHRILSLDLPYSVRNNLCNWYNAVRIIFLL